MYKFETGKTYQARSIGDYGAIFSFTVEKRTKKTITISGSVQTKNQRRSIFYDRDGGEMAKPLGNYSCSPTIIAAKPTV